MADIVNVGTAPNSGDGDTNRDAWILVNQRFQQLLGTLSQITWAPGLAISATPLRQWTVQGGQAYVAASNHIAAASFATDLAAGRWLAVDLADFMADLAAAGGAAMVGYGSRTLADKMNQEFYSLIDAGVPANDTGTVDRTALFLAAIATGRHIRVIRGQTVRVSNWLDLNDNQCIHIETGARINQVTADRGVFRATNRQNVTIWNDGIIHGPGVWSPLWTSNGAQQERGVMFRGCTNGVLAGSGVIRNFGHAQAAFLGGSFKASHRLEGTHTHGTPIAATNNWQMGLYVTDDDVYGPLVSGQFVGEISGVCQGVLRENRDGGLTNAGPLQLDVLLRDIPGQHGLYIQRGNLQAKVVAKSVALSAVKVDAPLANQVSENIKVDLVAQDIGSHMFEVQAFTATSKLKTLQLEGVGAGVGGSGLSMINSVEGLHADIVVDGCGQGFQAQGVNQSDCEVFVNAKNCQGNGVAVFSTNSSFRIKPTIREANLSNGATLHGILVESASATVDLIDPEVTDVNTRQRYALFNSIAGSIVRVHGRAVLTGGQLGDVRATGVIESWPEDTVLDMARTISPQNVRSPRAMRTRVQTTSASNAIAWMREIPDESAIAVTVSLVGKLAGSAQRASYMLRGVFFRDGGAATIQGTVGVLSSIASGSFAGVYSLATSGNSVVLLVNSGGAAVYDWTARVAVEEMA